MMLIVAYQRWGWARRAWLFWVILASVIVVTLAIVGPHYLVDVFGLARGLGGEQRLKAESDMRGSLVTLLAGFAVVAGAIVGWLNFQLQRRGQQTADQRTFRDQRRERLRRAYATVIAASLGMGQAVRESSRLLTTAGSRESLDDRTAGILREAFVDINRARVELMLDTEGQEVLDIFENVVLDAFNDFSQGWAARAESPGSVTAGELAAHRECLQEGIEALVQSARTHLDRLEQVIPSTS